MLSHLNIDSLMSDAYQRMQLDIRIQRLERINSKSYYMKHQNKSMRSQIKSRNKKLRKK